jgi:uncharacterized protein (TIGR03437 family)
MTRRYFLPLLAPLVLLAQGSDPVAGTYRFVELGIHKAAANSPLAARSGGGTITFDASGASRFSGVVGVGAAGAVSAGGERRWSPAAGATSITMASSLNAETELEVRRSADGNVLAGSSKSADGNFHLFAAVRTRPQAGPQLLAGRYRGGYMTLSNGEPAGLATGFVEFFADGRGGLARLKRIGHSARVDDVNRLQEGRTATYVIRPDGTGTVDFPPGTEFLTGGREIAVSADGDVVIGYSEGSERDFLMLVRQPEPADDSLLSEVFWISELFAETDFVFRPEAVRFGSSVGSLRADSNTVASVSQRVHRGAARLFLTTSNPVVVNFDGVASLAPQRRQRLDNIGLSPNAFAGALVGLDGELSLEHGIFIGVRAGPGEGLGPGTAISPHGVLNAASLAAPTAPLAPGLLVSLFGSGFSGQTVAAPSGPLPTELAGVRVTINGTVAPLSLVAPGQINLLVPPDLAGESAAIQVITGGGASNVVQAILARTSPGIFTAMVSGARRSIVLRPDYSLVTPDRPARPGDVLILMAAGLGAVSPPVPPGVPAPATELSRAVDPGLRVYLQGIPVEMHFSGLAPGFAGVYQVNFTVPGGVRTLSASPLAIQTSDSFTDLADIPVSAQ